MSTKAIAKPVDPPPPPPPADTPSPSPSPSPPAPAPTNPDDKAALAARLAEVEAELAALRAAAGAPAEPAMPPGLKKWTATHPNHAMGVEVEAETADEARRKGQEAFGIVASIHPVAVTLSP